MSSFPKFARGCNSALAAALTSCLVACGGGGGDDSGATATAGGGSAASTSSAAVSTPSSGSAASAVATSATSTASSPQVGIADAVNTMHVLSTSAMVALGLPAAPPVAATPAGTGRVFHVDNVNGSDSNDGLAAISSGGTGPWRTLGRLLSADLGAGDRVELACGGVWNETLRLPADGAANSPVVVAQPAAGCSVLPSIDGTRSLAPTAWTPYKGNIYQAAISTVPLQVLSGTGVFTVAHFPNPADVAADPGSPFLALAADSNGPVLTTGSDFVLPAGASIDTTTRVHVRTNTFILDESQVASFDGTHIALAQAPTYTVPSGWGYFLTGQLWMLRAPGEWYYDPSAKRLYAWMPDSAAPSTPVGVSTLPVGIDLQGRNHVVIDGLAVHGVGLGVDARSTSDVALRNMLVEDIADVGIDAAGSNDDVIESNGIARTGGDAITGWGGAMSPLLWDATQLTVSNNIVRDSGVLMQSDQVLSLPRRSLAAIFVGPDSVVTGNSIVNAGYIGIMTENGALVQDNFVYGACSVQDDCGGIYTGGAANQSRFLGNTVMHSRGYLFGQALLGRATAAQGIYLDDQASDMLVQGNTVIDTDYGIQLHNAARNTVSANLLFGNRRGQLWMQENTNTSSATGDVNNNVISGNQIAPISPGAVGLQLTTAFASTAGFGTFAGDRFYDRMSPIVAFDSNASGSRQLAFGDWTGSVGAGSTQPVDVQASAVSATHLATYLVSSANLVPNSGLQTDAAGWSSWNAIAPSGQATRLACPAGECLQYVAGGSAGVLSSPGFSVQNGAWYRLTVDVSTQTDNQVVPLVVRIGSGDYAWVSDRNLAFTANRAWGRHTVVFQATQTVPGGGARVDLDGIVAGNSITIAGLELVQITPDAAAQMSGVVVNAAATTLNATCPLAGSQPALCSALFNLASGQPITWPLAVPPRSSVIFYGQDAALVDSDGDGIPDSQDSCPGSTPGAAVNASGCELTAH